MRSVATEAQEQGAVIAWWALACKTYKLPESILYAVPNGAYLAGDVKRRAAQMHRLKLTGLRPGALDLNLDVARGGYHGLRLEMKRKGGRVSDAQQKMCVAYNILGYKAAVCWNADAAINEIKGYLARWEQPC